MHLKSTLITHRVLIRSWFPMTALGLQPPSRHHRAQADHHLAHSRAGCILPTSKNITAMHQPDETQPLALPYGSAAPGRTLRCPVPQLGLALTPASALGGFWVSDGVHQTAQRESPGQGQRKEKTRPPANSPVISAAKDLKSLLFLSTSNSLSSPSHISSHCSFFNYAGSSLRGFASHSQTSILLYGVPVSIEGTASS